MSLGFIKAAIRRRARFWCVTAAIGLLVGFGLYVTSPHAYQASTSLLLTPGPYENVNTAATNDQAMAQSRTVAGLAVQKLGLQAKRRQLPRDVQGHARHRSGASHHGQCTVEQSGGAPRECRGHGVPPVPGGRDADRSRALVLESLNQQINQAKQHISSINAQISQLSAQPASSAQQSQLRSLQDGASPGDHDADQPSASCHQRPDSQRPATAAAVKGSVVLDAATPLAHSRLKPLLLYAAVGLVVGLVLGMGIVVVQALVSDRLRRRDDVAQALGAPVKLSVGTVRPKRWLPGRRGIRCP